MKQTKIGTFFAFSREMPENTYLIYFDGGSRGNPGKAGAGAVIYDPDGREIFASAIPIGERQTNNFAEYTGMVAGLEGAIERGIRRAIVRGDSQLVIRQMRGEYKVKNANLRGLYETARKYVGEFELLTFEHIRRELNGRADALSNIAMDM